MNQILDTLKQSLLNEHVPSEQVQNILSSVDLKQLNLQDLPATTQYLQEFLGSMGIGENIISAINTNIGEHLGNFGIDKLSDIGVNENGIVDTLKNIFGGIISGD